MITIEVSPGELIDKITILEIKSERMQDAVKLRNVRAELAALMEARAQKLPSSTALANLTAELKTVNALLWQIEDDLRACECRSDFGSRFIDLARSVYRQNDRRWALKRNINELLHAKTTEEKLYAAYE